MSMNKFKKILATVLATATALSMPLSASAAWKKEADGNWKWIENGAPKTGWVLTGGKWYFMNSDGNMATGWKKVNGKWYYLKANGDMATGWVKTGGKWYYTDPTNGDMKSGKVTVSGKTYILGDENDGAMKSGKTEYEGKTYYLGDENDGAAKTGFIEEEGKTYFAADTGEVVTGVVQVNGATYYFDEEDDGAMATGRVKIDGKTYRFNEEGECQSYRKPAADVAYTTTEEGGDAAPAEVVDNTGSTGGSSAGSILDSGNSGTVTPPAETKKDFTITADEPTRDGAGEDGDANSNIGKYTTSVSGNTVTIAINEGATLTAHNSTAGQGTKKWVGVAVGTGETITNISYKFSEAGTARPFEATDVADSASQGKDDKTFFMWLAADDEGGDFDENGELKMWLSADGYNDKVIIFKLDNSANEPDVPVETTLTVTVDEGTRADTDPYTVGGTYSVATDPTTGNVTITYDADFAVSQMGTGGPFGKWAPLAVTYTSNKAGSIYSKDVYLTEGNAAYGEEKKICDLTETGGSYTGTDKYIATPFYDYNGNGTIDNDTLDRNFNGTRTIAYILKSGSTTLKTVEVTYKFVGDGATLEAARAE